MGWQGTETTMPLGMLFAKMYCCKCEQKLQKQKISKVFEKGKEGYAPKVLHRKMIVPGGFVARGTIGMDEIKKSTYVYNCCNCNYLISYDDQLKISELQKQLNKKALSDNELSSLNVSFEVDDSIIS